MISTTFTFLTCKYYIPIQKKTNILKSSFPGRPGTQPPEILYIGNTRKAEPVSAEPAESAEVRTSHVSWIVAMILPLLLLVLVNFIGGHVLHTNLINGSFRYKVGQKGFIVLDSRLILQTGRSVWWPFDRDGPILWSLGGELLSAGVVQGQPVHRDMDPQGGRDGVDYRPHQPRRGGGRHPWVRVGQGEPIIDMLISFKIKVRRGRRQAHWEASSRRWSLLPGRTECKWWTRTRAPASPTSRSISLPQSELRCRFAMTSASNALDEKSHPYTFITLSLTCESANLWNAGILGNIA